MKTLLKFLVSSCRQAELVAAMLMAVITAIVVLSAITRYFFAYPLPDVFDVSRLLLGATIMWGFASVGYHGTHIKVDLVAEMLPQAVRRWTDTIAWSLLLLFTVLLAWKLFGKVTGAYSSGESTAQLRLPVWPFYLLIWTGVAFSVLTTLARLILVMQGKATLEHFEAIDTHEEPLK